MNENCNGLRLADDRQPNAWQVLKRFAPALWPHRRALGLAIACTLLASAMTLLAPWPVKYIIDHALGGAPLPAPLTALLDGHPARVVIIVLGSATAIIAAIGALASALEKNVEARVREKMTVELRDQVLGHIQSLSTHYRTRDRTGELALRLVDDVNQVVRLLTKNAPVTLRHVITSVFIFVMMFRLDLWLGTIALGIGLALVGLARLHARSLRDTTRRKRNGEGSVAALAQEILRGQASVQALGAEQAMRERFGSENRESLEAGVAETGAAVAMERSLQIGNGFAIALMAVGGGLRVLDGTLTVGDLTIFLAYVTQLLKPIEKMNDLAGATARGVARGEKLLQLLARPPAVVDAPGAVTLARTRGLLEMRSVGYAYPAEARTTRSGTCSSASTCGSHRGPSRCSWARAAPARARSCTCCCGSSSRPRARSSSTASLYAHPARVAASAVRRDAAGDAPLRGTLRGALQPAQAASDTRLWRALAKSGSRTRCARCQAHSTRGSARPASTLSADSARVCSLARALLLDRPVLLLDEPLANVDDESQRIIVDALKRSCAGTHLPRREPSARARADRRSRSVPGWARAASRVLGRAPRPCSAEARS
jgi:ATP-binding cassette subfamily B protein